MKRLFSLENLLARGNVSCLASLPKLSEISQHSAGFDRNRSFCHVYVAK